MWKGGVWKGGQWQAGEWQQAVQPLNITHLAYRSWQVRQGTLIFDADTTWSSKYEDRHQLIQQAVDQGAVAAVVARPFIPDDFPLPYLEVEDTFAAYEALARDNRKKYQGKIIGITGSVGKTTTKEMLKCLLQDSAHLYVSHNKLNNYRGLVHNLAQCSERVEYSIYELGMATVGSIEKKSHLAQPHIALITDIQPDHLEHHKNLKSIARTKADIFKGMNPHGIAVLNHDNEFYPYLVKKAQKCGIRQIISFGRHPAATLQLSNYQLSHQGSEVTVRIGEQTLSYQLGVLGMSSIYNSLAALATLYALQLPLPLYLDHLAKFTAPEQRGELITLEIQGKPFLVMDQRYNSNLASLKACADNLQLLSHSPGGKRKTTFMVGDMEQLGKFAAEYHYQAGVYLAQCDIDQILYFGQYGEELAKSFRFKSNFKRFDSAQQLFKHFLKHLQKDEIMTIKGSWSDNDFDNIIKKLRRLES